MKQVKVTVNIVLINSMVSLLEIKPKQKSRALVGAPTTVIFILMKQCSCQNNKIFPS